MADYSAPLENDGRDIALEVNIPMSQMDILMLTPTGV
jgi:hypothetical protein